MRSTFARRLFSISSAVAMACFLEPDKGNGDGGGGGTPPDTAAAAREEYQRTFSATEALQTEIDGLLKVESPTAEQTAAIDAKQKDVTQKFARLKVLKGAIDRRAELAKMSLGDGTADKGRDVPGQEDLEKARQFAGEATTLPADVQIVVREGVRQWAASGQPSANRQFAGIITTTGNSILLPKTVMKPLAPTLDHVIARGLAEFGITPMSLGSTAVANFPVPDIETGVAITEGTTANGDGTQTFAGSFLLTPAPYGSKVYWLSNTVLNAPGYDLLAEMLGIWRYQAKLAEEAALFTTLKAASGLTTTLTTSTSALSYANVLTWCNSLPVAWAAMGAFGVLSADAYAATMNLTSDAGNKLVTVDGNGDLRVKGVRMLKATSLDNFGAINKTLGALFSPMAVKLRNEVPARLNRYVDSGHRDQVGIEYVEDHAYGWAAAGIALLKTPAA